MPVKAHEATSDCEKPLSAAPEAMALTLATEPLVACAVATMLPAETALRDQAADRIVGAGRAAGADAEELLLGEGAAGSGNEGRQRGRAAQRLAAADEERHEADPPDLNGRDLAFPRSLANGIGRGKALAI